MRFQKVVLAAAVLTLTGFGGAASAQPTLQGPTGGDEGLSSARAAPGGEGRSSELTPEMIRRARPLPLPVVDPDAVRAQGRAEAQSGARSSKLHVEGSTDAVDLEHH